MIRICLTTIHGVLMSLTCRMCIQASNPIITGCSWPIIQIVTSYGAFDILYYFFVVR